VRRPVLFVIFAASFACGAFAPRRCDARDNKGGRSTSRQAARAGLTAAQHVLPLAVKMSWPARLAVDVGFRLITPGSGTPEPSYVHAEVPGRLRVRMASLAHRGQALAGVERLLEAKPGVRSVETNLLTGSVLIRHDPRAVSTSSLLETLAATGHFDPKHTTDLDGEISKSALGLLGLLL
jgi:hypothetical protein